MRIALVIPRFDPHVGGAERWTWDFAARLVRHGHQVHVVAQQFADAPSSSEEWGSEEWGNGEPSSSPTPLLPHSSSPFGERGTGEGSAVVHHPVPVTFGTAASRRLGFAAAAEHVLRQLDVDVVHDMGHGWYGNVFMPHGGTRGGSFRQNLALWPRGLHWAKKAAATLLPRYRTFRQRERRQYVPDGSRLFVALSNMVRRDMVRYHSLPAELIRVVYNGVDVERFSPARRQLQRERVRGELGVVREVVFLLVAHNFKLKGVGPAIAATAQLAGGRRDVRLVIVGNDRSARYERLAGRLGCADAVNFVGRARDSAPFYAAADVYVHPTYYDPCSLVVLEALASGLPVITSMHNGAGELLTPGLEGFLLDDPADVTGLADRMRQMMDGDFRAACGRRARELAEQHDLERNYREIVAVYEEAIRRSPLSARRTSA